MKDRLFLGGSNIEEIAKVTYRLVRRTNTNNGRQVHVLQRIILESKIGKKYDLNRVQSENCVDLMEDMYRRELTEMRYFPDQRNLVGLDGDITI